MERFGKFQLLELIGRGGMAEVYLAKPSDAVLSKLVALKRILPDFSEDPSFREMFQREGSIALAFRHHGIIAVNEMGVIDQQCYMTMEYFPGKTLSNIVNQMHTNKKKVDATNVAFIIMRIAEALNYIHDFRDYGGLREIIHRDISPHNIMVGFDGAIKLIDFGIAKDTSHEVTQSRSVKGKVAYMSPEQVRGETLTKRTDIFSLGVVFWELLAQKKLFSGNTIKELTDKVKKCEIPPLEDFATKGSPALFKICERALSENPQARYHTAGEMAADLQEYLRYSGVENYQGHMSTFLRELFPDDITHLKNILRKYEGMPDANSSSPFDSGPMFFGSENSMFPSIDHSRATRSRQIKAKRWKRNLAIAGIFTAVVTGYAFGSKLLAPTAKNKRPPPPAAIAEAVQPQALPTPVPAIAPAPQPVVTFQPPRPEPQAAAPPPPMPKPAPSVPEQAVLAPPPPPVVKPKPVETKVVAKPPLESKRNKFINPPSKKQVSEPVAKVEKNTKRKPASKSAPAVKPGASTPSGGGSFAYITVISTPETKIIVNGKFVGQELTNEVKVPAGRPVTVKTVTSQGTSRTKSFNFKPATHNVIEMFD